MKKILEKLFHQEYLTKSHAKTILGDISEGKYNPQEISAFLTVFKMRNITVNELTGFRDCLRERCIPINLNDFDPVDLCGTGGDGKDTFNVSTLASFIVAGAGYKVAKHGNYGVSSTCGSSNVMEHLGYQFINDTDKLKQQIDKSGICFLHAPLFHPAMKEVGPIRRSLGVSTFFNMLGPMVNPSFPQKQLVGVFSLQLQRYYKYIYEQENTSYRIVHSLDGYDEISLTGPAKIITPEKEFLLNPVNIIGKKITPEELKGGKNVKESAELFVDILEGTGTEAQNAAVIANAAMAIECFQNTKNYTESMAVAKQSLESKAALKSFKTLLSI
ncbi:anthranilate phosphoribosyltransferase [Putridiphycobacter roseus]|uniref:Anthranilate phosphoribosyltransferase n=1 Tax=Putridiphycobacter roseus TaxID=2219161 RepID=A0A2W1NJ49_9FLAO|nr:anthranilate phosphoribosyltransferase [Putridiphycobacter roseus]PZE15652.1 anthranilate phosphoribosyltransferase [Putridiphycobacter roseus]